MLTLVREQGPGAVAEEMLPKLLGNSTRQQQPAIVEEVRSIILANGAEAIAGAITAMMTRPDSTSLLATIKLPTLVVVGEEDTLTPPPLSVDMHKAISGSELVRIPGAGHMANLEQPAAFNQALGTFLSRRV